MTMQEIDKLRDNLREKYLKEIDEKIEKDIKDILYYEELREQMIKEYRGKLVLLKSHGDYFIFEDIEYSNYATRVIGKTGLYYNGGSFGKTYVECLTLTDNYSRYTTNGFISLRENDREWFNDVVESKRKKQTISKK